MCLGANISPIFSLAPAFGASHVYALSLSLSLYLSLSFSGSLTAYAFRTNPKHELTQFGAGLYSAGNALGMFCLMKLFFFRGHRASDLALSCVATLFFSLYLVYDTYRYPHLARGPCSAESTVSASLF